MICRSPRVRPLTCYATLLASLAWRPALALLWPFTETPEAPADDGGPGIKIQSGVFLVDLEIHKIPVQNDNNKTVTFRISYLGSISIGAPKPQRFKMLFDTGSGQLIVPSSSCVSETCSMHSRYDMAASASPRYVQMDGRLTPSRATPEQVSIAFGQGRIRGEMVRERVCTGHRVMEPPGFRNASGPEMLEPEACVIMNTVTASHLSSNPWSFFPFDGIVGLGLGRLSLTPQFNFFEALFASGHLKESRFGLFLPESGEGSELALGGVNHGRVGGELQWTSVAQPEQGHWQVDIVGVHVGNVTLDVCRRGGCRGVIDTGTSHLAVPSPHEKALLETLTVTANGLRDCRHLASQPPIVIELRSFNVTLQPEHYMRQLPSPVGAQKGASGGGQPAEVATPGGRGDLMQDGEEQLTCKPRIIGVNMPAAIGAKTFVLGQPVLHRYYTVYDFDGPRIGFALASNQKPGVSHKQS